MWFEDEVRPRLFEEACLIRYADDAVFVFHSKEDVERVLAVLPKRFERFALALHPEKTKLLRFARPGPGSKKGKQPHPDSFDFLGFTHYWDKARNSTWLVKRKTANDRFRRAIKQIGQWCQKHRHLLVEEQHRILFLKLRGYNQYYCIRGNSSAVARFHH